jgi:hypothetical protein
VVVIQGIYLQIRVVGVGKFEFAIEAIRPIIFVKSIKASSGMFTLFVSQ